MTFLLLFGANSFEHEISIVSAITLKQKIKNHNLKFIFIDQNRDFYLIESENMKSQYFSSGDYIDSKKVYLKKGGFEYKKLFGTEFVNFDIAINMIHGRDGEDGKISSLLSFFEIKSITPPIEGSVLSYNKLYTKFIAKELGVKTLDYELIQKDKEVKPKFEYPVIIKPVRLGSSIGISVAHNIAEFRYGLDVAFEYDNEVIVEPFIKGICEYNLAGCESENDFIFSKVEAVKKDNLLSFEEKYLDFSRTGAQCDIEDHVLRLKLQEEFKKVYSIFKGALIRCDFFVKDGEVFLNEINPVPGSMANYLFEDFDLVLESLARTIKLEDKLEISYEYINKIHMAKGK
jgi:D-alanine-D-alanine ligase